MEGGAVKRCDVPLGPRDGNERSEVNTPSVRAISLQEADKGLFTAGWREKGRGKEREGEKDLSKSERKFGS